ncbi:MAG TPA: peptidylprolyl isomerase [Pyrinomonadaceae bacterium]|nr:peptidylprolyl isomerase [Pyrinomonadaceae bacterium]
MNHNFRHGAIALLCFALALSASACVKKEVKPVADTEAAVIETDFGRIVIELYSNIAPQMVARFKKLAGEGFYNGTAIHRIDPELGIIQGGDPNSKDNDPTNDGMGSSAEPNLPAEFSDIQYERGTVGAARSQAEDSANSQFYVTLKRQAAFDGRYTVFGRVIEGIGIADIISTAPLAEGTQDRPADKIIVKSITLAPRANYAK